MTGSRKASVFPLPVLAAKAALLPSSSRGTANCWIAVGLTWPSLLRAVSASGSRPILAHMADSLEGVEFCTIKADHAGRFLAAMLQGVQTKCG